MIKDITIEKFDKYWKKIMGPVNEKSDTIKNYCKENNIKLSIRYDEYRKILILSKNGSLIRFSNLEISKIARIIKYEKINNLDPLDIGTFLNSEFERSKILRDKLDQMSLITKSLMDTNEEMSTNISKLLELLDK